MRTFRIVGAVVMAVLAASLAGAADVVPGNTVEERAVNGAKAYLKKVGTDKIELTMMMVSLFAKSMPKYLDEWEKLTGIKVKTIEYGYTDIPAKIMQEGVAKTGVYDIFNDFPYTMPDAAGAKVVIPLDQYAATLGFARGEQ